MELHSFWWEQSHTTIGRLSHLARLKKKRFHFYTRMKLECDKKKSATKMRLKNYILWTRKSAWKIQILAELFFSLAAKPETLVDVRLSCDYEMRTHIHILCEHSKFDDDTNSRAQLMKYSNPLAKLVVCIHTSAREFTPSISFSFNQSFKSLATFALFISRLWSISNTSDIQEQNLSISPPLSGLNEAICSRQLRRLLHVDVASLN